MSQDQNWRDFARAAGGLRRKGRRDHGILGNNAGTVNVADRDGYQYVRIERPSGYEEMIVRGNMRQRLNTPVIVDTDPISKERYIAGVDWEAVVYSGQDPASIISVEEHAQTHEWNPNADDQIQWLHTLQLYALRTQPAASTGHVVVQTGVYFVDGKLVFKQEEEDVDLTSYYPASLTDHVMITLDENGDVQVVTRTETNLTGTWTIPEKAYVSAIVRLTAGEEITWGDEDGGDIFDLRFMNYMDTSKIGPGGIVEITDSAIIVGDDYPGLDPAEWALFGQATNWYGASVDALGMGGNWDGSSFSVAMVDLTTYKALDIAIREEGTDRFRIVTFDAGVVTVLFEIAQNGNITMASGATIDDMDPSAHIADDSAHHDPVTLGAGSDAILTLSDQELTLGDVATQAELDTHEGAANPHGTDFVDLGDTPSSLSGQGGKVLTVTTDESALEFSSLVPASSGGSSGGSSWFGLSWYVDGWLSTVSQPDGIRTITNEAVIKTVRAHVTRIGETGTTDIDLQYWGGTSWVSLFVTASKPSIPGYVLGGPGNANDGGSDSATPDFAILPAGTRLRIAIDNLPFSEYSKNLTVEVEAESDGIIPVGGVIAWSGSVADIPTGFQVCDGTNSTPDLRNMFIVGAGDGAFYYTGGDTGGHSSHQHTSLFGGFETSLEGEHRHSPTGGAVNMGPGGPVDVVYYNLAREGEHSHTISGSTEVVSSLPPYYALFYIIRVI